MNRRDYPVLIFPRPVSADREKQGGGGRSRYAPNVTRQIGRLQPQFAELLAAIEQRRITLQRTSTGIIPEMVLVLEVIGQVQNFIKAVKKIDGLEWLGEYEVEHIEHDDWFEDPSDFQKELKGQIFLTMTNQKALIQIRNLFEKWHDKPTEVFPQGLAPLREVFKYLHKIRSWDVEDRIRETGLLEDWKKRSIQGQEIVPFEVELWYSDDH